MTQCWWEQKGGVYLAEGLTVCSRILSVLCVDRHGNSVSSVMHIFLCKDGYVFLLLHMHMYTVYGIDTNFSLAVSREEQIQDTKCGPGSSGK